MKICVWMNILTIMTMGLVLLVSGCVNPPSATEVYYYQQPSRPILSSQERANLTEDDIVRMIQNGDKAYENGNYTLAKDLYYEVILALAEPNVYVLNSYAVCLVNLGLYENSLTIFNRVLEIDPYNETVRNNIAICRQFIAKQTAEQRQRELEAQRQQQENMQNLVTSLNAMSNTFAGMAQSNQNTPASNVATGSVSSTSGNAGSSSSSSGRSRPSGDIANMQRNYNQRAKATEMALDNYNKDPSPSLLRAFRDQQKSLKAYRLDCNKKGADIGASFYETVNP
jgi:tetratricopeptide (TPR) repeat protein